MKIQLLPIAVLTLVLLAFCSCTEKEAAEAELRFESHVIDGKDTDNLKSYYLSAAAPFYSAHSVVAYNYKTHSLEYFNEREIFKTISLEREGENGIPGELVSMLPVSEDSIWVGNMVGFYLLDKDGAVKRKYSPEKEHITNSNYAMNIAAMCWYEGRYLVFPVRNESSFCLNYLDTETDSICREILLDLPASNKDGKNSYAGFDYPHVSFTKDMAIYNYGYDNSVFSVDLKTGEKRSFTVPSDYSPECLKPFEKTDDIKDWNLYWWENCHYQNVMPLLDSGLFVRLTLLGSEVDSDTNPETIIDSKQICLTYMNDKFEVLFETVLPAGKYSNFSGWCALPECLMLYVDNRLDGKTDDQLEVEYISYP